MPLMIQGAIPLALACAMAIGPRRSSATWWSQAVLALGVMGLLAVAGLWLTLPWFTPGVLAAVFLVALAIPRLRGRVDAGWPSTGRGRLGLALQAVAALALGWIAVDARLAGERIPAGRPAVDLAFPLRGSTFLVAAGGYAALLNPHLRTLQHARFEGFRGQSYAADLVAVGGWGSRKGTLAPREPSAYAAWRAPVVAPCAGVVVRTESEESDRPALGPSGRPDEGNHVTVRCGDFEVVLAHLARGSAQVAPGDRVEVGTPLGLVGNSGSSDEPHLHVHAQRPGTAWAPLSGEPVPIRFDGVVPLRNRRFRRRARPAGRDAPTSPPRRHHQESIMRISLAGLAGLILLTTAAPTEAQSRWGAELRGGAAVSTQDLGDAELSTGVAFDGTVRFRLQPHLSAYAGWDWVHFSTDDGFAGEVDVEETGYVFGVRFDHPFGGEVGTRGFFLRAGATVAHLELEDEEGEIVADSEHGLGWEAGAGVWLELSERWQLTPGVRYRALSRDLELGAVSTPVDLTYLTVSIGLVRLF
jgi:hypothetical protein